MTMKEKVAWLIRLDKDGELIDFLDHRKHQKSGIPGKTYLQALFLQVKELKDLNEDEKSVVGIVEMAANAEHVVN